MIFGDVFEEFFVELVFDFLDGDVEGVCVVFFFLFFDKEKYLKVSILVGFFRSYLLVGTYYGVWFGRGVTRRLRF